MKKLVSNIYLVEYYPVMKAKRRSGAPNSILIERNTDSIIIDPGVYSHNLKILKQAAKKGEINLDIITKVALTHVHHDHIWCANWFERNNGAKIYIHEKGEEKARNRKILFTSLTTGYEFFKEEMPRFPIWIMRLALFIAWGRYRSAQKINTFKDEEYLDKECNVKIISLPSHTPDSVGFYLEKEKIFIGGDLIDLDTGRILDLNSPSSDFHTGINCLRKLIDMDIEIYVPGHGKIIKGRKNVHKILNKRLQRSLDTYNQLKEMLSKRKYTFKQIVKILFPAANSLISFKLKKQVTYCLLVALNRECKLKIEKQYKSKHVYI